MIRVVIADDQLLLRNSISKIISTNKDISVVDTVGSGKACVASVQSYKPDVVLMDIEMPDMNGIAALKIIKKKNPETKVIILTTFDDTDNIIDSFSSGADGFVVKDVDCDELVSAIKCVNTGLCVIHESVKNMMVNKFIKVADSKKYNKLDEDEILIVKNIVDGKSNKDIAKLMNYSEGTIKNKVSKIYEKLGISDRLKLAIFAVENGIT